MRNVNVTAILLAIVLVVCTLVAPVAAQQVTFPNPRFVTTGTSWSITLDDSDPNKGVSYQLAPSQGGGSKGWLTLGYSDGDYILQSLPKQPQVGIRIAPIPLGGSCPYSRSASNATYTIQVAANSTTYYGCGSFTQ